VAPEVLAPSPDLPRSPIEHPAKRDAVVQS
jgi:hypothetical protein